MRVLDNVEAKLASYTSRGMKFSFEEDSERGRRYSKFRANTSVDEPHNNHQVED